MPGNLAKTQRLLRQVIDFREVLYRIFLLAKENTFSFRATLSSLPLHPKIHLDTLKLNSETMDSLAFENLGNLDFRCVQLRCMVRC
jgi:hypothetical protein